MPAFSRTQRLGSLFLHEAADAFGQCFRMPIGCLLDFCLHWAGWVPNKYTGLKPARRQNLVTWQLQSLWLLAAFWIFWGFTVILRISFVPLCRATWQHSVDIHDVRSSQQNCSGACRNPYLPPFTMHVPFQELDGTWLFLAFEHLQEHHHIIPAPSCSNSS